MYRLHHCIRARGNNAASLYGLTLPLFIPGLPALPQTRHRHRLARFKLDEPRILHTLFRLPFIKTRNRNNATTALEGMLERRLLRHRLAPRIGQLVAHRRLFRPRGYQPPALRVHMLAATQLGCDSANAR